ncbi:MAG: transglycosylase SLT domain-containing protein, partial [Thermoplasmata archaeon]|nr:transglycosylase SLT domain-containing protein [Thermoplasmata archaeon]
MNSFSNIMQSLVGDGVSGSIGKPKPVFIGGVPKKIPDDVFESYIDSASKQTGVPKSYIRAILERENAGHYENITWKGVPGVNSSATGPGQLLDSTAKEVGVDSTNPEQNILGTAKYIKKHLDSFGGDFGKAAQRYIGGTDALGTTPGGYSNDVLGLQKKYSQVYGESDDYSPDNTQGPIGGGRTDIRERVNSILASGGKRETPANAGITPNDIATILLSGAQKPVQQPEMAQEQPVAPQPAAIAQSQIEAPKQDWTQQKGTYQPKPGDIKIDFGAQAPLPAVEEKPKEEGKQKPIIGDFLNAAKGFLRQTLITVPSLVATMDLEQDKKELESYTKQAETAKNEKDKKRFEKLRDEKSKQINTALSFRELAKTAKTDSKLAEKPTERLPGLGGFAQDVTAGMTQLGGQFAASAINPTMGLYAIASQIGGNTMEVLNEYDITDKEAIPLALLNVAIQTPLERVGMGKIAESFLKGSVPVIKKILTGMAGEGSTEFVQQLPDEVLGQMWGKTKGKTIGEKIKYVAKNWKSLLKSMGYAGAVGAVTGGGAAGAGHLGSKLSPQETKPVEEVVTEPVQQIAPEVPKPVEVKPPRVIEKITDAQKRQLDKLRKAAEEEVKLQAFNLDKTEDEIRIDRNNKLIDWYKQKGVIYDEATGQLVKATSGTVEEYWSTFGRIGLTGASEIERVEPSPFEISKTVPRGTPPGTTPTEEVVKETKAVAGTEQVVEFGGKEVSVDDQGRFYPPDQQEITARVSRIVMEAGGKISTKGVVYPGQVHPEDGSIIQDPSIMYNLNDGRTKSLPLTASDKEIREAIEAGNKPVEPQPKEPVSEEEKGKKEALLETKEPSKGVAPVVDVVKRTVTKKPDEVVKIIKKNKELHEDQEFNKATLGLELLRDIKKEFGLNNYDEQYQVLTGKKSGKLSDEVQNWLKEKADNFHRNVVIDDLVEMGLGNHVGLFSEDNPVNGDDVREWIANAPKSVKEFNEFAKAKKQTIEDENEQQRIKEEDEVKAYNEEQKLKQVEEEGMGFYRKGEEDTTGDLFSGTNFEKNAEASRKALERAAVKEKQAEAKGGAPELAGLPLFRNKEIAGTEQQELDFKKGKIPEETTQLPKEAYNKVLKGELKRALKILPKGTGKKVKVTITKDFNIGGRGYNLGGGDKAAVLFNKATGLINVWLSPELSAVEIGEAMTHELPGHYGQRVVFAANPAIHSEVRKIFDSERKAGNLAELEKIYSKDLKEAKPQAKENKLFDEWVADKITDHIEKRSKDNAAVKVARQVYNYVRMALIKMGVAVKNVDDVMAEMVRKMRKAPASEKGTKKPSYMKEEIKRTEKADTFFPPTVKAVQGLKQERGTGDQMFAMITKTPGVKEAEWKWMGLDDFLKGKPSVTKGEIEEFVRGNQVRVEEVEKGIKEVGEMWNSNGSYMGNKNLGINRHSDGSYHVWDNDNKKDYGPYNSIDEAKNDVAKKLKLKAPKYDKTKFSQYSLPGGENYREVLLTLPGRDIDRPSFDKLSQKRFKKDFNSLSYDEQDLVYRDASKFNMENPVPIYRSSHWDEPNVIAHIRLDDRTGPNGERVLFVEEIQSDWSREAREKGIAGKDDQKIRDDKDAVLRKYGNAKQKLIEFFNKEDLGFDNVGQFLNAIGTHEDFAQRWEVSPELQRAGNNFREAHKEYLIANEIKTPEGVPAQPFLKNWEELTLKRVLRMAAEEGYDRVAWTTGQQHFDRWGSEQFRWKKDGDGFLVDAKQQVGGNAGGIDIENEAIARGMNKENSKRITTEAELADAIRPVLEIPDKAPLMAKKLWERMKTEDVGQFLPRKEFYENMYDGDIRKFYEKYGKKWGTKVEDVEIGIPGKGFYDVEYVIELGEFKVINNETGESKGSYPTRKDAEEVMNAHNEELSKEPHGQMSIPITPEMKESVLYEGQPMFQKEDQTKTEAFKKWFGDSKVVDDNGEPLVVYHGTK